MDLQSLDHVHFSVPDLERAERLFGPFLHGHFTPRYGAPEYNAWGAWHSCGGDFIQPIELGKPCFGGAVIERHGILSPSFRVADVDTGIAQGLAAGLRLRSRVGSEDVGLGKNVVQGQFWPDAEFGIAIEVVEHQLPDDPHRPMTETGVDHLEYLVPVLDGPVAFFERLFGSAFGPAIDCDVRGGRSRRHARFGIQITAPAPAAADGHVARVLRERGAGIHAIAFRSLDLAVDAATAAARGWRLERGMRTGPAVTELEFAAEDGVILKLVERGDARAG